MPEIRFEYPLNKNGLQQRINNLFEEIHSHFLGFQDAEKNDAYYAKLEENAEIIVSVIDDHDVGFVAFYANNLVTKIAFISALGVKPEFHRLHIARKLAGYALSIAKSKGMEWFRLEVDDQNTNAISFYESMGFERECFEHGTLKIQYSKKIC